MAKIKRPVDTGDFEESVCAPAGKYRVLIKKAEEKKSESSGATYLAVQFEIAKGKFKGASIFEIYNLWNDNQTAKRMAEASFKTLVMGIYGKDRTIDDTDQLVGKAVEVELIIKDDANYGKQNKVKTVFAKSKIDLDDDDDAADTAEEAWAKSDEKGKKGKKGKKDKKKKDTDGENENDPPEDPPKGKKEKKGKKGKKDKSDD